jgi:hypothetical protein
MHEALVGGTSDHFLRYVLFEREALGEAQGDRQLLAERLGFESIPIGVRVWAGPAVVPDIQRLHALEQEFELPTDQILGLIEMAPRLKMAVRGWVAERHLRTALEHLPSVIDIRSIEQDGRPDFQVILKGGRLPVLVECKNVLRNPDASGRARLDFQRTRASKKDPCSRYYSAADFQVIAACLHPRTQHWEFKARHTANMAPHRTCRDKLASNVVVDGAWTSDLERVLLDAAT